MLQYNSVIVKEILNSSNSIQTVNNNAAKNTKHPNPGHLVPENTAKIFGLQASLSNYRLPITFSTRAPVAFGDDDTVGRAIGI